MKTKWVIWLAISLHLLWGVLILTSGPIVTQITAIHTSVTLFHSVRLTGCLYLLVALLSMLGLLFENRRGLSLQLLLLLPQQLLLMLSALGACQVIYFSRFATGELYPRSFLIADQAPAILVALFHTCALWQIFGSGVWLYLANKRIAQS